MYSDIIDYVFLFLFLNSDIIILYISSHSSVIPHITTREEYSGTDQQDISHNEVIYDAINSYVLSLSLYTSQLLHSYHLDKMSHAISENSSHRQLYFVPLNTWTHKNS